MLINCVGIQHSLSAHTPGCDLRTIRVAGHLCPQGVATLPLAMRQSTPILLGWSGVRTPSLEKNIMLPKVKYVKGSSVAKSQTTLDRYGWGAQTDTVAVIHTVAS